MTLFVNVLAAFIQVFFFFSPLKYTLRNDVITGSLALGLYEDHILRVKGAGVPKEGGTKPLFKPCTASGLLHTRELNS